MSSTQTATTKTKKSSFAVQSAQTTLTKTKKSLGTSSVNHSNHASPGLSARSLGKSVLTVIGGIKFFVLISKTNTKTKKIDKKTNAYTSTNTNATTNATTKKSSFGIQSTEANI